MKISRRIENLPPYFSTKISQMVAAKKAKGEEIISFATGDPDIPTPAHVIDELCRAARDPANHRYPASTGLPEYREAIVRWYQCRFGVYLDSETEVVPLLGAKEGIAHIAQCLIDEGDIAIITDPGYPVYSIGTKLCGGQIYYLPLDESNNYLPNLRNIPEYILKKTKVLWLNYPNNPTGAIAGLDFFNHAVEFARKNNLVICHDGPYTEVAFDGYMPVSYLQAKGAKEVGIEFHSLSKTYNMAGWRIGMAVGNTRVIEALSRIKSNIDSGIPQAIQYMGVAALTGKQDTILEHNIIYQRRRDKITDALKMMGIQINIPKAGLYIWAKVPDGYTSDGFVEELLDKAGVVVTPGTVYGPHGEGFFRVSLTLDDDMIEKGLARITDWKSSLKYDHKGG